MKASYKPYRRQVEEPTPLPKQEFQIYIAGDPEVFDRLLDENHYIGRCHPVGDYLRVNVFCRGDLVALMSFGASSYALGDRDRYIGWSPRRRAECRNLIVQNRRFALLVPKGEQPNLASQVLSSVTRVLPGLWQNAFGYQPLAVETFTDIEAYEGTCYKASNWMPLGLTKGFSRHKADFFEPNGRPKKLWIMPLRKDAFALLREGDLPEECRKGAQSSGHGVLPLNAKQMDSLYDSLRKVPDPRARNRKYNIGAILSLVVMAMMCGRKDLQSFVRFGQSLTQAQRKALGLPRKAGAGDVRQVPSYRAYWNLLTQIDPDALAETLSAWTRAHHGSLPAHLALDGKMFKNIVGVVSLVDSETGVPVAMAPMRHKEEGPDGELTCGRTALQHAGSLENQTVTGDALHLDKRTAQQILGEDGDYLLQIKDNHPTLRKYAQQVTRKAPLFVRTSKADMVG